MNSSLLLAAIPATAFAAFSLLLQRHGRAVAALVAAAVMATCLALLLPLAPAAFAGHTEVTHRRPHGAGGDGRWRSGALRRQLWLGNERF